MSLPAKKATNISLSVDVLVEAKAFGINISQACDQHLRTLVRQQHEQRWLAEFGDSLALYNQIVEEQGLPLEQFRSF